MRHAIHRTLSAYGRVRAVLGFVFLIVVAAVFVLMSFGVIWIFVSTYWNGRTLRSEGVEAQAWLAARPGMGFQDRRILREGRPEFSVTWTDTTGKKRTSSIRISERFGQALIANKTPAIRIRYVQAKPSTMPAAVDDDYLLWDDLGFLGLVLLGTAASLGGVGYLARRRKAPRPPDAEIPAPLDEPMDITAAEWGALQASPSEELLRSLYARSAARYRIADMLRVGPARTFEEFSRQAAQLFPKA